MKYRPEIDGLRAIAVVPVIFFHAGFEYFNGGFVGVDVFFVISGFLITTIILTEKEQGTFTLLNFYERRARRILPALYLVLLFSLPFAWFWLFPFYMEQFSKSVIAVTTFTSNILFWQESGYFGTENEQMPLLHTWSLAVEEQYYLVFPLFLMLMWKLEKRWILFSFLFLTAASLLLAHWGARNYPTAFFFLLPTRAWELAIGASIAFCLLYEQQTIRWLFSNRWFNELFAFAGVSMIGYSVLTFSEATPLPSFYALLPTAGAGLVILCASGDTRVGRILGSPLPVGIGLLSYSAYLWHQPLFAFSRHRTLHEPGTLLFVVPSLLTFLLAYLSWRYVEVPFRKKDRISGKSIIKYGVTSSLFFLTFGLAGYVTNGFDSLAVKNKVTQDSIDYYWEVNYGLSEKCFYTFTLDPDCRTSDEPEILVWGDSFAMHLVPGILASNPGAKIIQMTKSVCGPFFNVAPLTSKYPLAWAIDCLKYTQQVHRWIANKKSVKYAVISTPFNQYLSKENALLLRKGVVQGTDYELVLDQFMKTLDELKSMGVTPVVFLPPPANGNDLGSCLAKAEWHGLDLDNCDFKRSDMTEERKEAFSMFDAISEKYKVIRLDELICDDEYCKTHIDSTWIFRDAGHFSFAGSKELGRRFGFYELITDVSPEALPYVSMSKLELKIWSWHVQRT